MFDGREWSERESKPGKSGNRVLEGVVEGFMSEETEEADAWEPEASVCEGEEGRRC